MLPLNPTTSQFLTLTQELILGVDLAVPHAQPPLPRAPGPRRALPPRGRSRAWRWWAPTSRPRAACGVGGALDAGERPDVPGGRASSTRRSPRPTASRSCPSRTRASSGSGATRCSSRSSRAAPAASRRGRSQHRRRGRLGGRRGSGRARATHPGRRCRASTSPSPGELSRLLRQSTAFFSALLFGIGALGLVIGGLSLANTVTAAVFERIRDFGIKRALGRHRPRSSCARCWARRSA